MKPIYETEWKEWISLPIEMKAKHSNYLCNFDIHWGTYYIESLLAHIRNGGKIQKHIWEKLPKKFQNFLKTNY